MSGRRFFGIFFGGGAFGRSRGRSMGGIGPGGQAGQACCGASRRCAWTCWRSVSVSLPLLLVSLTLLVVLVPVVVDLVDVLVVLVSVVLVSVVTLISALDVVSVLVVAVVALLVVPLLDVVLVFVVGADAGPCTGSG